eukprot:c18485_g1_i2.p1 GENE.c18485_g1_i2~~c18485_g1_i2.p1  ORF type:complete len:182 (+),score=12.02 c18485_g1_i2:71-616(+)
MHIFSSRVIQQNIYQTCSLINNLNHLQVNIFRLLSSATKNKKATPVGDQKSKDQKSKEQKSKEQKSKEQKKESFLRYLASLEAPMPGVEGRWVPRDDFTGEKGFGIFHCPSCKNGWYSAHAYKIYRQGCQKCEKMFFPIALWVNKMKQTFIVKQDKIEPHRSDLCEACQIKKCTRRNDDLF